MRTLPPEWAPMGLNMTLEVRDGDLLVATVPFTGADPDPDDDPSMPAADPWRWADGNRYHYVDVTPRPDGDGWTWDQDGYTIRVRPATPDELAERDREFIEA